MQNNSLTDTFQMCKKRKRDNGGGEKRADMKKKKKVITNCQVSESNGNIGRNTAHCRIFKGKQPEGKS